jgi:muramoyltetrapeptide carboxypeptidase
MTLRPAMLRPGDPVALVAPSGAVPPERVTAATGVLTGWGLRVRAGAHALGRHPTISYLAGTDEERLADLNAALRDEEIRAVLCLRGGYGMQRIVNGVDFAAVRSDPKLVMGFSDVTALHLALWAEARLATVHGPTAALLERGAGSATAAGAYRALMTGEPVVLTADPAETTYPVRVPGRAEGILLGGNLTLLAASAGTPHQIGLHGAILLLEDVHEEPYQVDRALGQLLRSGWLDGVAGIAIGQFTDSPAPVAGVLAERLGPLGVPVLGGLPAGHGDQQTAVGLGVPAVLDADAGTLTAQPVAVTR